MLEEIDADLVVPDGDRTAVLDAAAGADALLNTYLPLGAEDIARLAHCRVIARYGIGVDNLDLDAARDAGIVVTNVPDYCVEEVAAHTLGLILAAVRRTAGGDRARSRADMDAGRVAPHPASLRAHLRRRRLGRIGRAVIDLLRPLGGRIVGYDPYAAATPEGIERVAELDALLAGADVVCLHLPVTVETRGLFDGERFDRMKAGSILVNTSRGALVRTPDLVAALRGGRLAGAAVDVLEREAADAADLADIPGAIVTPHMAYYSEASLRESQRKATTQVVKVLTGREPDYAVT